MSFRCEWVSAAGLAAEYYAPGCDIGGYITDDHALVISTLGDSDGAAIHGTPKELRSALAKMQAALAGEPEQPDIRCNECGELASSVDERGMCPDC